MTVTAPPGPTRHRSGAPRLTPSERGVLALMALGLSNRAIAQRLFLSPKTVENHIAKIFTKMDLEPSDDINRRVVAVLQHLDG
jgi:DNA-binding NarL/FixJ family response regulator